MGDMPQLGFASLAEDQKSLAVPMKPHRPRLRRVFRIDGREPDDLLLLETALYMMAEFGVEVQHATSYDTVRLPGLHSAFKLIIAQGDVEPVYVPGV
jgi:hypothetical protein